MKRVGEYIKQFSREQRADRFGTAARGNEERRVVYNVVQVFFSVCPDLHVWGSRFIAIPVSPVCEGCKVELSFCVLETRFLTSGENKKVWKQPELRARESEENRVRGSPTKNPRRIDPVDMGSSLGRLTRDIGQHSKYGSSLGLKDGMPIGPTIYKGISLRGLRESQRSIRAPATPSTGAAPRSSLGYTTPAGTVEGLQRVLLPAGDLTPPVM